MPAYYDDIAKQYQKSKTLPFLVGVAFQPRKKIALKPQSINRGWKAAPTEITPFPKLLTLRGTLRLIFFFCLRGCLNYYNQP